MNSRLSLRTLAVVIASGFLITAAMAQERGAKSESNRSEVSRDTVYKGDYILQPSDVLRVFVFQHDDINKQCEAVSISQEFTINLPLIGTLNLKGKTARQAEEIIRALYDKDYLVRPQVSVIVLKYVERFVNVAGAVNNAGRIPFPQERGMTIVDAITAAGGPSRIADLKKVKLTRTTPDGEVTFREINVDVMFKSGGRDAVQMEKDDAIYVPERIL